jgi:hypothetical protein
MFIRNFFDSMADIFAILGASSLYLSVDVYTPLHFLHLKQSFFTTAFALEFM